ncbi:MAG: divergent polysaccharide deacetylase family protein, partial [Proteobacteria bacterium]|nr:divergent polysaccharide deacetylase family protein [Pseudomonadota bacterium]
MATDDLTAPLGQDKAQSKRWVVPAVVPWSIAASLGSGLAVYLGWAAFVNDPYGGEPVVVVPVTVPHVGTKEAAAGARPTASAAVPVPAAAPSSAIATTAAGAQQAPVDGSRTVTIIDGSSGQRKEVPIGAPAAAKSAPVGDQKSEAPGGVKPAPLAGDPRLLESTRHGEIPRVGTDGVRALDVYARRQASRSDVPRIAIVVSGLGIGTAATAEALAKLPGPVTYALAPYAADVDRLAARARAQGHELLLQVPMEPLDFPDNDPGPQTLLTSLTPEQNLDRLYWLMSRFRGYVGIANFMGARFTATDAAVAPIL